MKWPRRGDGRDSRERQQPRPSTSPRTWPRAKPRAWGEVALRAGAVAFLFVAGVALLGQSTFAIRLREDVPVPGGPYGLAVILSGILSVFVLLARATFVRRFLGVAFFFSAVGAHWWSAIAWEELVTETNFNRNAPPGYVEYVLAALPVLGLVAYLALSRRSVVRADLAARGVDRSEAQRAARSTALSGIATLVIALGFSAAIWGGFSFGLPVFLGAALPRGFIPLTLAALLVGIGFGALGRHATGLRFRLPWTRGARREDPAQSRGRKSPS